VLGDDLHAVLGASIPGDHSRQTLADDYIPLLARSSDGVLDLGCGPGGSVDQFRAVKPEIRWVGVDLDWSPEVARRTRTDAEFRTFDGAHIPAESSSLGAVFCKQVLEHVTEPDRLMRDVARILRPGGLLAGSTSQLEPYHSLSVANPTAYGLRLLLERSGLELVELRPGIDGLTLVLHRALGMPRLSRRWWSRESPLNRALDAYGRARRLDTARINAAKLVLCGQFAFLARRPTNRWP
jgi:SAM-dependent methyltransferase